MFTRRLSGAVELRLLEERHAGELFRVADQNRGYLREWLPWVDRTHSAEDTLEFIRSARLRFAENGGFAAGIWRNGELAGCIDLHRIDWANRNASIGYWLAASCQGKGLMTVACAALIDHAFHELKLNRVEIRCATGNTRSCAIPARLGFTQEGVLRQGEWVNDHFVDLVVYGMLSSEWATRPPVGV